MRLIDADALRAEYQAILDRGDMFCEYDIIGMVDKAPTVEPCYQTTLCLDCKMYDKENHHCPRFCEVIRELVKEANNE